MRPEPFQLPDHVPLGREPAPERPATPKEVHDDKVREACIQEQVRPEEFVPEPQGTLGRREQPPLAGKFYPKTPANYLKLASWFIGKFDTPAQAKKFFDAAFIGLSTIVPEDIPTEDH